MLTKENRAELMSKAHQLLKSNPFSKQAEAEFVRTCQLIDLIDADKKHDDALRSLKNYEREEQDTRALRVEEEWRHFVHRPSEKRTYAALETGQTPGSAIVPTGQWLEQYQARLKSASGWLRAGATVQNTESGVPFLSFFSDDTANDASILSDENMLLPQVNPIFSVPTPALKNFATSVTVSNQLGQDSQIGGLDSFLQGTFGSRIGRKLNSDATSTLLPLLTVGATSAFGTVPTLGELVDMQDQIDSAYLETDSQPCYMMSQSLRNSLLKQTATGSANFLYPEIKQGQLLGLPLVINTSMTANAGDVAVVCGSVKRAVLVQSVRPVFVRSFERYAEQFQTLYGMVNRLGVKLIDVDACVALKLHA